MWTISARAEENALITIRIADAEFLVRRFETRFNEQDQLVALCLNVSGRYQTIGQYVSGLDDSLVSVEKFLDNNYGEPDSTNCVYQANHIPKEEFRQNFSAHEWHRRND